MRRQRRRLLVGLLTLFVLGAAASARASVITLTYDFVADFSWMPNPISPVTGSFSVTFDNASDLIDQTSGLTVWNLSILLDSAPAFTYFAAVDSLRIGGIVGGANTVVGGTNDFILVVGNASTNPRLAGFAYEQISAPVSHSTEHGTLTPTQPPVPEPTLIALVGFGLISFGARRWRYVGRSQSN